MGQSKQRGGTDTFSLQQPRHTATLPKLAVLTLPGERPSPVDSVEKLGDEHFRDRLIRLAGPERKDDSR
jgi:hypothetical protein